MRMVFGHFAPKKRQEKVLAYRLLLCAILALSAFWNLSWLTSEGYANVYYAATVKNMLTSWHNFFFASYDAGFVSVDKPPLGFWIQAANAYLFGFHGWSLLLPQALAGVLCVALLYYLVGRSFGTVAGLLAALALTLTPISVATNRHNNLESLLVFAVLLASWAFILAAETGRLRWLVVGGFVIGLGFNIKMLEAFVVLPAFYVLYLVAAPVGWRRRMIHLGLATVVIVATSLPWVVAVDLTPAEQRPYVGSSSFNTVTDLIVGWNGVERLSGSDEDVGDPGPLRLLNPQLGGQIGWLLPLAIVGLAAASWRSWQGRPSLPLLNRQQQALVLWGTWLISLVVFFSVAGDWDPHYLAMLAPAVAALVGAGVVALWDDYQKSPGWRRWILPLTLVGTAGLQVYILAHHPDWSHWLAPTIVSLCLAAAASSIVARLRPRLRISGYPLLAIGVGVGSLFLAPSIWVASTVWYGAETRVPTAGPQVRLSETSSKLRSDGSEVDRLVEYLEANQGDAKYLVAAIDSSVASPIILNTDEPVIAFGGFEGRDQVFRMERLAGLVNQGTVRFFIVQERDIEHAAQLGSAQRHLELDGQVPRLQQLPRLKAHLKALADIHEKEKVRWITDNCEQVPKEPWQSSTSKSSTSTVLLYDCGIRVR
ncbi:MAG: glycosyltransferase family 39 protein [Rubrobacteraceae bacterium]|nr:glycosyltransferase family 39 protein [Rubrobacteraceae bacterium]